MDAKMLLMTSPLREPVSEKYTYCEARVADDQSTPLLKMSKFWPLIPRVDSTASERAAVPQIGSVPLHRSAWPAVPTPSRAEAPE